MPAAVAALAAALLVVAAGEAVSEATGGRALLFLSSRPERSEGAADEPESIRVADPAGKAPVFQHPGLLISKSQLDFVRAQVAAGAEPIHTAFVKAKAARIGSLSYKVQGPPASGIVECGPYSRPDFGCLIEQNESSAALLQSYLWAITGNSTYGENAVRIMDTWAEKLRGHNNSNAPLQSGWTSAKWSKAAELIAHTNFSWPDDRRQAFLRCLTDLYLPEIVNGSPWHGNWELTMIDGMIGIAVLTENRTLFDHAVTFWRQRVPAYLYVSSDGPEPRPAPRGVGFWNQTVFDSSVDGLAEETCRDLTHTSMGIAAMINTAETAFLQGVDLYGEEQARIVAGLEFQTGLLQAARTPLYVCQGTIIPGTVPTYEIAYNHYVRRKGLSLPNTLREIEAYTRIQDNPYDYMVTTWETLTHGASP